MKPTAGAVGERVSRMGGGGMTPPAMKPTAGAVGEEQRQEAIDNFNPPQ